MALRTRLGVLNGIFDLWVSKPGIDVRNAQPGQFLLGGQAGPVQIVHQGLIRVAGTGGTVKGPATYSAIALPSKVAGLSNLVVWGQLYSRYEAINSAGNGYNSITSVGQLTHENMASFRVVSGSLFVKALGAFNVSDAKRTDGTPIVRNGEVWAQFVIFRLQY